MWELHGVLDRAVWMLAFQYVLGEFWVGVVSFCSMDTILEAGLNVRSVCPMCFLGQHLQANS